MFPVQNGLYGHRSTMNQYARPGYPYLNFDPYPFTNANLGDFNAAAKSPLYNSSDDLFDQDQTKEDTGLSVKKPLSKAERRAEHNAIERARRENLNHKFQTLARALPNLSNYRRPSKSQIVEKALEWVKQGISREERYQYQVLQLQRENKKLLAQLMQNNEKPIMTQSSSTLTNGSFTDLNDGYSSMMMTTPQMTPNSSTEDFSTARPIEFMNLPIIPKIEEDDSSGYEDDTECDKAPYYVQKHYDSFQHSLMSSELYSIGFQPHANQFNPNVLNTLTYPKYADTRETEEPLITHRSSTSAR